MPAQWPPKLRFRPRAKISGSPPKAAGIMISPHGSSKLEALSVSCSGWLFLRALPWPSRSSAVLLQMREKLSAEAAVRENRMISAAEERIRKLVGAVLTVISLVSFYQHRDLAYLGSRSENFVGNGPGLPN